MEDRIYIAIDLKSFYASVECRERGLDPLDTNLVVADISRTDKTICLAVTPSLKSFGMSGRSRLFEVKQRVREVNIERKQHAPGQILSGTSHFFSELSQNQALAVDFLIAPPQMAHYMECSTRIYSIYTKYIAPEDIVAKHLPADEYGVRIAFLDEMTFRQKLWAHQPLTDFWRIGHGYARKLAENGLFTMGDIARCSVKNEDLLYRLFGKNAELLIDHAWGFEPCTVPEIKAYKPETNSISSGQVLHCPYETDKAKLVLKEMADQLALDLVNKKIVTDQIVLTVGYDIENLSDPSRRSAYHGSIETDRYGRSIPKQAHGTQNLDDYTSSSHRIMNAAVDLFDRLIDPTLLIRRLNIVANHIIPEDTALQKKDRFTQLDLFTDYAAEEQKQKADAADLARERKLQEAMLSIRKKFGKNAVLKAMNLEEGATAKDRNNQIGGHKA